MYTRGKDAAQELKSALSTAAAYFFKVGFRLAVKNFTSSQFSKELR